MLPKKRRKVEDGIWQLVDDRWLIDIRPEGENGGRFRKVVNTKGEARRIKSQALAKASTGDPWKAPEKDKRRLKTLIDDWYDLYGYTLKDGDRRKSKLIATADRLGNPMACNFSGEDWLRYRKLRLQERQEEKGGKLITPNTVNHEHAYLSAVFGTLKKLKNWKTDNPMQGIPKLHMDEPELTFLELDQIRSLLDALSESKNPHVIKIAKICLATGSRWGEAETLRGDQVKHGKIHLAKTKNGNARSIPISPALERELIGDTPKIGRLFKGSSIGAFRNAVDRAGIELPEGQLTHVLRHSFASHFMINDGNILKLKDILGHKTLAMTMRYAKLAPRHLIQAVTLNPLASLEVSSRCPEQSAA